MIASCLVDTGPLVAILNLDDKWHRVCVETLAVLPPPFLTTEAVLAELFHFIGDDRRDVAAAWKLIRSGVVTIGTIADSDLSALEALMAKYHDRPMDFADATLVHLAQRERITTIFTVDNADFETYRLGARKRFSILPGRVL